MSIPARSRRSWVFGLLIGVLVVSLSVFGVYAAEEGVSSEMAEIDYETIGQLMGEMSKVEEDKGEVANKALEKLFDEIETHLKEEAPEHVETFKKRAASLIMLDRAGVLNSNQVASEVSQIVESAGGQDPDGKVPATVLEKLGVDEEKVKKLMEGGLTGLEVAEVAREMAQDKQKQNKQERVEGETETQERNRETKEVKSQEQKEEKVKEQSKEKKGNSGNAEKKGKSSQAIMGDEKGEETGNSQKGKPKDTPGNSQSNNGSEDQNIDREEVSSSSDQSQKGEQPEEDDQGQGGSGNSGDNPGSSGEKGEGNADKERGEKDDDENPGKSKGGSGK